MTKRKITKTIKMHQLWLDGKKGGKQANFKKKNLKNADFSNVNLSYANFEKAKLFGANFTNSQLHHTNFIQSFASETNFSCADLTWADFFGANLKNSKFINACAKVTLFNFANLFNSDFSCAELHGANFKGAYLDKTNLNNIKCNNNTKFLTMQCPETGEFIGYKKASNYIVKLSIPKSALRSSATTGLCRCNRAEVLSITKKNGNRCKKDSVRSSRDKNFVYTIGKMVKVKNFDTNRWHEKAPGIHFFMTRQEAVDW